MKKIISIFILSIFLISLSSALDDQRTGKQNEVYTMTQTCNEATSINITSIGFPGGTVNDSIVEMTPNGGGSFNYNFTKTSLIGRYDISGVGDGCEESFAFYFKVTPTGDELETPESMIYIIILFFTFILFVSFLYLAVTIPYRNEISPNGKFVTEVTKSKYAKLLCIWFTYGFFMWFLQTLNFISISFIKAETLTNFIINILIYVGSMSVGVTFLILTWMFIAIWKDIIYNRQIRELGKAFIKGSLGGV